MKPSAARFVAAALLCGAAPLGAQTRLFLTLPDQEATVPTGASNTLIVAPGTTLTLEAWLDDTGGDLLGSYQIAFQGTAAPLGASGAVTYVDTAPPGGSIAIATSDPAWVFSAQQPGPFFSEALPSGFAVLAFLPTGQGVSVPGLGYLGTFDMSVSTDAGGTFILDYLPQGAAPNGGTSLSAADGGSEVAFFVQRLFIVVEPPPANDRCQDAAPLAEGSALFNNAVADDDAPLDSFGGACLNGGNAAALQDLWYEYTAPCAAQITVSTCDTATFDTRLEVYDGCGVCPPTALLACNDDGTGCGGGTSQVTWPVSDGACYTIRLASPSPESVGPGSLTVSSNQCVIEGVCHAAGAANPMNECEACNLAAPASWTPRSAGTACGDPGVSSCDGADTCDGAGNCDPNPVDNNTPCTDGDICTTPDRCVDGSCLGTAVDCDDGFDCTTDTCTAGNGCESTIDAGFCLLDVCYADGTELPGLPCHFCLVAFSQTEVTVVDDGPGCGPACASAADCGDQDNDGVTDDACAFAECLDTECSVTARNFADAGGAFGACPRDGFANIHDRNHVLACFAQTNPCDPINIDLGGAFGACPPDGFCNIHDANHVLAAFAQTTTCTCPGTPTPEMPPVVVGETPLVLRVIEAPDERIAVAIYTGEALDELQGYQLEVQAMDLTLVEITYEGAALATRPDQFCAANVAAAQMLCSVEDEGVATPAGAHLATYWFDPPQKSGVVDVAIDGQTFLIGREGGKITIPKTTPALIDPVRRPGFRERARRSRVDTRNEHTGLTKGG